MQQTSTVDMHQNLLMLALHSMHLLWSWGVLRLTGGSRLLAIGCSAHALPSSMQKRSGAKQRMRYGAQKLN